MRWLSLFILAGVISCAHSPELHNLKTSKNQRAHREALPKESRNSESTASSVLSRNESKVRRAPAMVGSMEQVVSKYRGVIDQLGKTEGESSEEQIQYLKQNLAHVLSVPTSSLTILTNPQTGSGWFGDSLVSATKEGNCYFIDKRGKWFEAKLKDRVLGGVYTDEDGHRHLLTVFYGALSGSDFYRAYLETVKLKVLSFNLDRQNDGSISGKLKLPSGKILLVRRTGRDNSKIVVNDQTLVPLFQ